MSTDTIENFRLAQERFWAAECRETAMAYRSAAYACLQAGGTAEFPSGYPEAYSYVRVCDETADVMQAWLQKPHHFQGCVVAVPIDANLLMRVLNSAATKAEATSELWHTVEALRDIIGNTRRASRNV